MNLVYISNASLPSREANSIQIMNMCAAFSENGHDVSLVSPRRSSREDEDVFEFYGIDEEFEIYQLPWRPLRGYQYTPIAALLSRIEDADVVYSRSIAGCYFATKLGLPVIYESHSPADNIDYLTSHMFRALMSDSRLRRLVVISNALKEYYVQRYDIKDRILRAHDAAGVPDGTPIPEIENRNQLQAGYIGQLYSGKGVSLISEMAERIPSVTFHVVGGNEEVIRTWRDRTSDLDNITFHGFVKPNRVDDYLQSFDVLLAPYRSEVYGSTGRTDLSRWMSPLKIFEYMAIGKPILCSNLPVLREVLTDKETALLCDPDRVEDWTAGLSWFKQNPEKSMQIGNRARKEFRTNYTYSARADRVLNGVQI